MKLSQRERWLAVLLPATLTGILYIYLYARPQQFDIAGLKGSTSTKNGKPASFESLLQDNIKLTKELDLEKSRAETLKKRELQKGDAELAARRAQAWKTISSLLESNNLRLISSTRQSDASKAAGLAPDLKKWAVAQQKDQAPQLWRLELIGNYGDTRRALEALSTVPEFIIPVSLEMDATAQQTAAQWWLEVWL